MSVLLLLSRGSYSSGEMVSRNTFCDGTEAKGEALHKEGRGGGRTNLVVSVAEVAIKELSFAAVHLPIGWSIHL